MRIASLLSNTLHLALITFHFSLSSTLNEPLRSIPTVIPAPILTLRVGIGIDRSQHHSLPAIIAGYREGC